MGHPRHPSARGKGREERLQGPLSGWKVIVTRPRDQAEELVRRLQELGAECLIYPTIRIVPPRSYEKLDRALQNLHSYHWVVFTSANGVRAVLDRMAALGMEPSDLGLMGVAAIGPATREALEEWGIQVSLSPREYRAEGLVEAFSSLDIRGKRVLLPRAEEARDILPKSLRTLGAEVDVVPAYRTVPDTENGQALRALLAQGEVNAITFTSPSTVRNFLAMVGEGAVDALSRVVVACIGPVTADAARDLGIRVDVVAKEYTAEGLVNALVERVARDSFCAQ